MADKPLRRYIFASDFDQTLTFNDSGYVLAELVGIPTEDFERKAKGMAKINLVQQGAELAYLLLHDPEFKAKVRKEHLHEVGKRIRLKGEIQLLYQILKNGGLGNGGFNFDAKVRRQSLDPADLFHGHIGGLDVLARGLKGAAAMITDGTYDKALAARYAGWQTPAGQAMLKAQSLADIAARVEKENINPQPRSGQQEYLENLVNRFV